MLPRGVWLIIAGVLLLGHTPASAKPSILMVKRGGVYYISSREQPQANQAGRHTASLQWLPYNPQARPTFPGSQGSISRTDQSHDLRPGIIKAASRIGSRGNLNAASAQGVPGLSQLRLKKAHDLQVGNASDPQGNMWTAPRYLGWLWAKTGCRSPLALAASNSGSQRPDLQQNLPPVQEIQALVREVCKNFLAYAPAVPTRGRFLSRFEPTQLLLPGGPTLFIQRHLGGLAQWGQISSRRGYCRL